jgi:hypothetical protein
MRYAGELGEFITDEYYARERAAAQRDLNQLAAIDRRAALGHRPDRL